MHDITFRVASLADVISMAQLRETSGWQGGAEAETMLRHLAGEHHPQHGLMPRMAFVAESAATMVGYIAGHRTTRSGARASCNGC